MMGGDEYLKILCVKKKKLGKVSQFDMCFKRKNTLDKGCPSQENLSCPWRFFVTVNFTFFQRLHVIGFLSTYPKISIKTYNDDSQTQWNLNLNIWGQSIQ